MQLNWNHIQDKQPEHDEEIVQVILLHDGDYNIAIRKYYQKCTWQELVDYYKSIECVPPNFFWISVKDFPFPKSYSN